MTNPLSKWFKITTMIQRLRQSGIRDDVVNAAELTVFGRHSDRALPALARSLDPVETVDRILEGRWNQTVGLVVLTDHRLVLYPRESSSDNLIVVGIADIIRTGAERRRGEGVLNIIYSEVGFANGARQVVVDQIMGSQAQTMAQAINEASNGATASPLIQPDPLELLTKLRSEHAAGSLTDEEFERKREALIRQI